MRELLRPILLPLLRRHPDEVERQARHFSLDGPDSKELVAGVGRAFLGGYHAMLEARALGEVSAAAAAVDRHFRPFFFEGAAMGYLPRGYFTRGVGPERVEADLLELDPRFLYLYYVGLGFWYGFRHPRRPGALESLAPRLDPFYVPLCYDGLGFKIGFFDVPGDPGRRRLLQRAPAERRAPLYQGFGRSLFFVCMDDDGRFQREKNETPAEHRSDLEAGRSLALAFTGVRRPERILNHWTTARDEGELGSRLLGATWALTAREMNDPDYFAACLRGLPPAEQTLCRLLPQRCREALESASTYEEWRLKTTEAAIRAYSEFREAGRH